MTSEYEPLYAVYRATGPAGMTDEVLLGQFDEEPAAGTLPEVITVGGVDYRYAGLYRGYIE